MLLILRISSTDDSVGADVGGTPLGSCAANFGVVNSDWSDAYTSDSPGAGPWGYS